MKKWKNIDIKYNIKISTKLYLLLFCFIVGFVAFGVFAKYTLDTLRVNGPIYHEIIDNKDVLADILPPPLYILESYLVVQASFDAKPDEVKSFKDKFATLKKEYNERCVYWQKELKDEKLKELVTVKAFQPVDEFFNVTEKEYFPALESGDKVKAQAVTYKLSKIYLKHRSVIDEAVKLAATSSEAYEKAAARIIVIRSWILFVIGIVIVVLSGILCIVIIKNLLGQLGADPAEVKDLAGRVAAGDVSMAIDLSGKKGDSLLAAMYKMVETIKTLVADINMLSQAAVEGNLAFRVDVSKHQGEFRKMAQGLNATINRLVELLDNMPTPCLILDQSLSIMYINQAGARIGGKTQEQCIGTQCYDYFKTSDCHTGRCACVRAMKQGQTASSEAVAHPLPGVDLDFAYTGVPIKNPQGNIIGVFELINDQTAAKNAVRLSQKVADYQDSETSKVVQRLDQLARGETDFLLTPGPGDTDTIGVKQTFDTIANAINTLAATLARIREEDRLRDWFKNGMNELNTLMRGEQKTKEMADKVLTFLAEYLKAGAGAFYTYDEKGPSLLLSATYAFSRRKNSSDRFQLGEGLIGQSALEKRLICLTNIPPDYLQIGSALGESVPANIVALPLIHNDQLVAALELGTFAPFTDNELDFLNHATEGIAIGIGVAHSRQRINELLEQTQQQTEELRVQQEELQQTNVELEEKTQILQESEEKLRYQSEELQAINEELEENNQILEKQKVELDSSGKKVEAKARELALVSKYKTEFLANMSHELRSPLNSLLILAKILSNNEEGNLSEKQVESAKIILKSGQNLLNLISDVLDISKIEAGKLEIILEKIKIDELTDTLYKQFMPVARDKNINFKIETAKGLPKTIITDIMKAEQILKNLLSNAFKFTSEGSVTLKVHLPEPNQVFFRGDLHPENAIAFSVIDTGIGIPLDKQKIIFEAFKQVDGSISRKFGGTGLGLSISKELSNKLGGEIYIESKEGKGSVFTLFLPLELQPEPETTTIPEEKNIPQPKGISREIASVESLFLPDDRDILQEGDKFVLVIEDDSIFAKILMGIIHKKGYKCLAAGNGKNGLFLASQYKPAAIILDIVLPDINGLAVLEQLKENFNTRHIPVHIISVIGERTISLNKGAIGHLTKPVSQEAIEDVLTKLESVLEKTLKELLIVEDEINNQKAIIRLLENKGVNITVVNSGEEAWDILTSQKFDCIILDLGLPGMTGFQLLDKLHSEKFSGPFELAPVIIYTNRELTREEYLELNQYSKNIVIKGANSPERLLDEVSLFLHSVESSLPKSQQKIIRMLHDPDQVLKNKKILLVDDDLPNTFALSSALNKYGLDITLAENGQMALEKLDSAEGIDLVLMDIMMPVMDGLEATKKIRAQKKYSQLPIIALTAKAMPEDRAKCIEAGANDYLTKPIDIDKLIAMLRIWLFESKR